MPEPKAANQINERHAKLVGDFLVELSSQIVRANKELRLASFTNDGTVIQSNGGRVRYELELGIRSDGEDKDRTKTSKVVVEQDLSIFSPPETTKAVFSSVVGAFLPAEANRDQILSIMAESGAPTKGLVMLSLGSNKYWVRSPDQRNFVVQLDPLGNKITIIKTFDQLNQEIDPMFQFLSGQLKKLHGE
jgi:hypothetical protein